MHYCAAGANISTRVVILFQGLGRFSIRSGPQRGYYRMLDPYLNETGRGVRVRSLSERDRGYRYIREREGEGRRKRRKEKKKEKGKRGRKGAGG